jgi:hemerythrin-like domain-containing protein
MPIQIGAKRESNFEDPIGLLTDCHRRIEHFLSVLGLVAEQARGGMLDEEQRRALDTALRYFREAAPKHTADEEETLFPRMRKMENDEVRAVLSKVDLLHEEHERADRAHAEMDRLGTAWLQHGSLPADDAMRLCELMQEMQELYRAHIALEEVEVFPAAARNLDLAERSAAGREMAARRGVVKG